MNYESKLVTQHFVSSMWNALIRKRLAPISGNIEMKIFISSEADEKSHYLVFKILLVACVRDASYPSHTLLQRLNGALIKWWYLKEKSYIYPIRWNFSTERHVEIQQQLNSISAVTDCDWQRRLSIVECEWKEKWKSRKKTFNRTRVV